MTVLTEALPIILVVALIAVIVLVIISYRAALKRVGREGLTPENFVKALVPIVVLFVAYLALNLSKIAPAEWAQILLTAGLVVVTIFYAFSAARQAAANVKMAEATKQQAEASVKMAEEMRKQRYSGSLPLVVPTVVPMYGTEFLESNEIPYECLQSGMGIKVIWQNLGTGVAINVEFFLKPAPLDSSPREARFLVMPELVSMGIGDKKEFNYFLALEEKKGGQMWKEERHTLVEGYRPSLEAKYEDIYERKIITVQEIRIEEHNNSKRAFLTDLYFVVNGKRIGEEIVKP